MSHLPMKKIYNIIIIVFIIICVAAVFVLSFAYDSLRPIIYGCVIAYIFKPTCNTIHRLLLKAFEKKLDEAKSKKYAHILSIVLTYIFWGLILYLVVSVVLPQFTKGIIKVINDIPSIMTYIITQVTEFLEGDEILSAYASVILTEINNMLSGISSDVLSVLKALAGGMINGIIGTVTVIFNVFVGLIVSIYLLSGRKKLAAQAKMLVRSVFGKKTSEYIIDEVMFADKMFSKYFVGSLIDSSIVGIVCYIGCLLLKIPYAPLVAVTVGVTNIIPFFGPYIGMIPSAVIILTVSPVKAIIFIIMMIIIQQLDGNILAPHIIGANTGLSSFWVLFAILLFGGLFGFVGMIIGVPVFACIYDTFGKLIRFCLKKRGEEEVITHYEKEFLTSDEEKKEDGVIIKKVRKMFAGDGRVLSEEEEYVYRANDYPNMIIAPSEKTVKDDKTKEEKTKEVKEQKFIDKVRSKIKKSAEKGENEADGEPDISSDGQTKNEDGADTEKGKKDGISNE